MSSKKSSLVEQFVTAFGGAAIGALGGHSFGDTGIILGSSLGAPLGYAIANGFYHPLNRVDKAFMIKRRILLKEKLHADFNNSFLLNNESALFALKESIKKLVTTKVLQNSYSDIRIPADEKIPNLISASRCGNILDCVKILSSYGSIKISCLSVHPGVIGVLKSLKQKFSAMGLCIDIYYDEITGRNQAISVIDDESFDFAVFPNDPFFLYEKSKKSPYRLLFPVNCQIQCIFYGKRDGFYRKNQIFIYHESTAQMQYALGQGIPREIKPVIYERVEEISLLANDIEGGDMIIVWEPLSGIFRKNKKFEEVPNSRYRICNSLFCHKRWRKKSMSKLKNAFKVLFVNEWQQCNLDRNNVYKSLVSDEDYLRCFLRGARNG